MTYKFSFRRRLFWRTVTVTGHRYDGAQDRMILFIPKGGVREIAKWSTYDARLGADWMLAMKTEMEKKAGQSVPVSGV